MNKLIDAAYAASLIKENSAVMIGGFLDCGAPDKLIDELIALKTGKLTMICNDTSYPDTDKGKLVQSGQVEKIITSHIGTNPVTGKKMLNGEIKVEIIPMGTLIEKIRARGAGLGGFLTPTGVGTILEEGKKIISSNGKKYIFEEPLGADFALIYGTKADKYGNVTYSGTTRNFNETMATAADVVICQADEVVDSLNPDEVVIPGVFVDYVVEAKKQ